MRMIDPYRSPSFSLGSCAVPCCAVLWRWGGVTCSADDPTKQRAELDTWVKNFLWAGLLLRLHGEKGKARHLYLTQDLTYALASIQLLRCMELLFSSPALLCCSFRCLVFKSPKKDISKDQKIEVAQSRAWGVDPNSQATLSCVCFHLCLDSSHRDSRQRRCVGGAEAPAVRHQN